MDPKNPVIRYAPIGKKFKSIFDQINKQSEHQKKSSEPLEALDKNFNDIIRYFEPFDMNLLEDAMHSESLQMFLQGIKYHPDLLKIGEIIFYMRLIV